MPSEILAFVPSKNQTQTLQSSNTLSGNEDSQPGLFDSFMSEYLSGEDVEDTTDQNAVISTNTGNQENTGQLITFTGSNSFSQSVIDILASLNDDFDLPQEISDKFNDITDTMRDLGISVGEKIQNDVQSITEKIKAVVSGKVSALNTELPDDIDGIISQILNDESLPEDTKNEIINALDDFANVLRDSDLADENVKSLAVKISDVIHENIDAHKVSSSVEDNDDASDSTDETDEENADNGNAEIRNASLSTSGVSVIPTDSVRSDAVIKSEATAQTEIPQMNHSSQQKVQSRKVSDESKTVTQGLSMKTQNENESETESVKNESNFDEHLEHLEHSDTENGTSKQNNNPSGHEDDSSGNEPTQNNALTSRTRNDSRRTSSSSSSRTQNERTESNSHRTESRSTFQSFFEGVLSNRRNASQSSALPLNLRTASYTLNQSQTLRDGMINVVRFIRADGVQKANVVIDPPALGRISVELSSTSSGVEASIKVASEQIRQLVQDQLSELRMNLSQQGVQVAEFTVDVQQDNSGNSNHQGSHYENERRTFAISEADDETEEFRIDLEEGLLYWVA